MKKNLLKDSKWTKPTVTVLAIITGGALFGYWFYVNLDYQDEKHLSWYEGYQISQPEYLQQKRDLIVDESIAERPEDTWTNPKFAGVVFNSFAQDKEQNSELRLPNTKPIFNLINVAGKQTAYQIVADLSSMRQIESVSFPTWGEKDGFNDLQIYEGHYDSVENVWKSEILVKDHLETGMYQTDILIKKKSGNVERVEFSKFNVSEPEVQAEIDGTKVDKGQFDVNIHINSKADVEKISVPIWAKEDQSDLRWYEGQRIESDLYRVHMDYEDFDFYNGLYTSYAYLTTANGLKAQSAGGTAEINVNHPVRIRVLHDTILFEDRKLTKEVKKVSANSMAYIKGVVFNSDQKVYRTSDGYISSANIQVNEMMDDIRYVAHRGNHQVAPENSIPSFQQADSWGVETDIWLTKDKKWIVMHDDTVDRMTNGSGKISNFTLEEIRKFRIDTGSNKDAYNVSQLVIPTLEEYLSIMAGKNSVPFIEIKSSNFGGSEYDSLIQLINQYGMANSAVVISFDYNNLVEIKKRAPEMQVQLLGNTVDEATIDKVSQLGSNAGIDIQYSGVVSNIALIAKAQAKGLSVHLWGVPRDQFTKMKELGIDNLTTDFD